MVPSWALSLSLHTAIQITAQHAGCWARAPWMANTGPSYPLHITPRYEGKGAQLVNSAM